MRTLVGTGVHAAEVHARVVVLPSQLQTWYMLLLALAIVHLLGH